jgi:hypothetical protein
MSVKLQSGPVQPADNMDDETFCLHMTYRHPESLGGLDEITPVAEGTTEAWRNFHHRLHALAVNPLHEHSEE